MPFELRNKKTQAVTNVFFFKGFLLKQLARLEVLSRFEKKKPLNMRFNGNSFYVKLLAKVEVLKN